MKAANVPDSGTAVTPAGSAATPAVGRKRQFVQQFVQFGLVGASGFVVNQAVFVLSKKLLLAFGHHTELDPFLNLLGTQFHVRWYHVFSIVAFLVANIWNFCLNRAWTFRDVPKNSWWRQLPRFMAVGIFGLFITLVVSTALVNPESPLALPRDVFDGSTGLRTAAYWGNFMGVIVAIPANFLFNKLWTFRPRQHPGAEAAVASRVVPPRVSSES